MATCRSSSSGNMFKENIDVSELTLPSIAGRLSRLETQGLSYDELQQFFGSRRRVGPVKEKSSVKHVATPAQETDRIVQAYLHLTHVDSEAWRERLLSSRDQRTRFAPCKPRVVIPGEDEELFPQPTCTLCKTCKTQQVFQLYYTTESLERTKGATLNIASRKRDRDVERFESSGRRDMAWAEAQNTLQAYSSAKIARKCDGRGVATVLPQAPQSRHDALGGLTMSNEYNEASPRQKQRRAPRSTASLLADSEDPPRLGDSLLYCPSRRESNKDVVSLISPRTSRKIRRLPPPGHTERAMLQDFEKKAARFLSKEALKLNRSGGLYSIIGRNQIGLTERDIEDLTATVTGQTEDPANCVGDGRSLTEHDNHVWTRLIRRRENLLAMKTPCFYGTKGSGVSTKNIVPCASSPDCPAQPCDLRPRIETHLPGQIFRARSLGGGCVLAKAPALSLKASKSLEVCGVDKRRYEENVSEKVCWLQRLLRKSSPADNGRPGGRSPFINIKTMKYLGILRVLEKHRGRIARVDLVAGNVVKYKRRESEREDDQEEDQGERGRRQPVCGNSLLRSLARALLFSVQARIQRKLVFLAFRKWQVAMVACAISRYMKSVVLIQSCTRRSLSLLEVSKRRGLRSGQATRERQAIEAEIKRRQEAALVLQRWFHVVKARRRMQRERRLWRAVRIVQQKIRLRAARVKANNLRAEKRRRQDADIALRMQQLKLEEETQAKLRSKLERLVEKEAILENRRRKLERRFQSEGAAVRIQTVWRAWLLRRNLPIVLRVGKRKWTIRIQGAVRGFLAGRRLQRRRKALKIRFENETTAVVKIQCLARRVIAWNKADAIRFERQKERLVSTLDAEFSLRGEKLKVPLLKACAKRQGVVSATGKGQPYIIDVVALKVLIANKKRALNPWQARMDRNAATKIQAVWRGSRQVRRVRRMRIRQSRERAAYRRVQMRKAARDFQRIFRGMRGRLEAKSRRYGLKVVRIQKVWRGFLGRRVAADRRQLVQAAVLLQRRLRGTYVRMLAARMRQEAATSSVPVIKIQTAVRRHLAQSRRRRLVAERQVEWELSTTTEETMRFCAERVRLRIIVEGAAAHHCRGDGVTQFIFRKLGSKRSGDQGLGSFRMGGMVFAKFFTASPGILSSSFRTADIDLTFTKVKDKGEKTITYAQFIDALNKVASILFPQTDVFGDFQCFEPKSARLLGLLAGKILEGPGATEYLQFSRRAGERVIYRSAAKIQVMIRRRLGRKRIAQKKMERETEARERRRDTAATKIQALARMICARSLAIRLAKVIIAKYIDPIKLLPYWVHGRTNVASWTKPKIFRSEDVDRAIMVATSKTEHFVKCSVCNVSPVKRLCTSCKDSFCDECFQALHGKGRRRDHAASTVQMCCVCKYQHGSRLCETCSFKASSTCAYCDVCFFHRHPGLDPLIDNGAGSDRAWNMAPRGDRTGSDHKWTAMVVMCVECRRYAARWLCDGCEEVYCVSCYTSVHRYGTKVNHGAEKLPYYLVDLHMEYAIACKLRRRDVRNEGACARWVQEQERRRQRAATAIQAGWRGKIGRIEGQAVLKAGRVAQRKAWRQRKRDERVRNALWYGILDTVGLAPRLKSDTVEEQVLRSLSRVTRKRARNYIELNREDYAWASERLKLRGKKGVIKRGFAVGELEELLDQARRGGVRLPGRHRVKYGHSCVYTDPAYDVKDLVGPRNIIRVGGDGELYQVEAVFTDRVSTDHAWNKPDDDNLLLYRVVLNRTQKLHLRACKAFWSSGAIQYGIQVAMLVEERVIIRFLRSATTYCKKKRRKILYHKMKERVKRHEEHFARLKLRLNNSGAPIGLESSAVQDLPMKANPRPSLESTGARLREAALPHTITTDSDAVRMAEVEHFDEATGRRASRNTVTGNHSSVMPRDSALTEDFSRQKAEITNKIRRKRAGWR